MCMEVLVPHSTNIKRIKQMFEPNFFFIILLWRLSWYTCYFFALLLPFVHSPATPCCFALLYLTILPWSIFLGLFKNQIKSWNGKFENFFFKFDKFFMFHLFFWKNSYLWNCSFCVCVCIYIYVLSSDSLYICIYSMMHKIEQSCKWLSKFFVSFVLL